MQFESLNENYIRTYDDIITKDLCDELISEFERNEVQFDKQVLKDHRSFTQVALQQHPNWKPYADELQGVFNKCVWRYMQDCQVTDKMFPPQYAYEMYRMKRYKKLLILLTRNLR